MKKNFWIIVFVLITLVIKSQPYVNMPELSPTSKILGLSRLWEGVRNNFVYYDQLSFNWDSLYAVNLNKVLETKDAYEYIKILERMTALLKDGHTYLQHNITPDAENIIKPVPFTTKLINGKVYVDQVWRTELLDQGIHRGTEIVSINDLDVIRYGEVMLGQYVSSSTRQWLDYKVFNQYELTKDKCNEPIKIGFSNGQKIFSVIINRNKRWDIQAKQQNRESEEINNYSTLELKLLKNNIGLLTIHDFMDNSFKKTFDSIYSGLLNTKALIIDIRDNGGGRSDYADYVLAHFSTKPIKTCSWTSRLYIPAHASWNEPQEWFTSSSDFIKPAEKEKIYDNPIILLVNAGTFSSSEDFCVKFRGMKRGKIMGTTTGGSTGNGVEITLIEGQVKANICSKKDIAPDGSIYVGIGVIPDIEIIETKDSFLEQKDIQLENAINQLNGH